MIITSRFRRFALIGGINTLVDASLFAGLHASGINLIVANVLSTSAGVLLSMVLNTRYTFKSRRLRHQQIVTFIAINITGLWLLQPLVIAGLLAVAAPIVRGGFITSFAASLAATAVTFMWNYLLYSRFVYTAATQ